MIGQEAVLVNKALSRQASFCCISFSGEPSRKETFVEMCVYMGIHVYESHVCEKQPAFSKVMDYLILKNKMK